MMKDEGAMADGRRWQEGDPMPSALAGYAKLLEANGFEVRLGYAESFEEGGEYGEKAAKAGEKKPDSHLKTVWVDAYDRKNFVTIAYQYANDGAPKCNMRMWNLLFEKVSDADMKQRIKNARNLD